MGLFSRLFGGDKPPWRKLYDPLMDRYAVLSGAQLAMADARGSEFSPLDPLAVLLQEFQPTLTEDEISDFLESCKVQFDSFAIGDLLTQIYQEANLPPEEILGRLEERRTTFLNEKFYNGYLVRFVIGELIGYNQEAGPEERKRYWAAMLAGDT